MYVGVVGAVVGAAGSYLQGQQQQTAAERQAAAARQAQSTQEDYYKQNLARMQPYADLGREGVNRLREALPALTERFDLQKYYQSPEYAAQLSASRQAADAMRAGAAARGMYGSGSMANALAATAQEDALAGYQQALQNYQGQTVNQFNVLQSMIGAGQSAAAGQAGMGQNVANAVGNLQVQQGQAQANAALARGEMYGDITNQIMGGIGAYNQGQLWRNYMQPQAGGYNALSGTGRVATNQQNLGW